MGGEKEKNKEYQSFLIGFQIFYIFTSTKEFFNESAKFDYYISFKFSI
jgi:hypothetical protein